MSAHSSISIAIACEHTLFREGLRLILSGGVTHRVVIEAESGPELLLKLEQSERLPDICLLTTTFPILQGQSTIRAIKNNWPGIKILLITTYCNREKIGMVLPRWAHGLVPRSCTPRELKAAISTILDGNTYIHNSLEPIHSTETIDGKVVHSSLQLKAKHIQFLSFCLTELTYAEIAEQLGINVRTVDGYREALFKILNVTTRTGLVMFAVRSGIEEAQINQKV